MGQKIVSIDQTKINEELYNFVNSEVIEGTGISKDDFWNGFVKAANELAQINKNLLKKRDNLQKQIDDWHAKNKGKFDFANYKTFLKDIGYIVEEKGDFKIETSNVDDEIAKIAGPQLVVPVDNARYALNAANARWGSLYDALYGTDVISEDGGCEKSGSYNPKRGEKVIAKGREFLNENFTLANGSWLDVKSFEKKGSELVINLESGSTSLKDKSKFAGYSGEQSKLNLIVLRNNNLHALIKIDPNHLIGKSDKANISDIVVESAISTIMDLEDSVAAVDGQDKVKCYRNWLGIMKGTLQADMSKGGKSFVRKLNPDQEFLDINDKKTSVHGRSLILVRNVGHLMTNPAIILNDGSEIPEGIMDGFITVLCALHDFKLKKNSRTGSV
ncbi:MAG: malate synthase G, partial [Pelagibacteraceae bacterium]